MIAFIIIIIIISLICYYFYVNNKFLCEKHKDNNTIIFGAKGTGKDLLTQNVIYHRKKEKYFSNNYYGYKYNHISLVNLDVVPNTFENLIKNEITVIEKNKYMESVDVYLSDAGIYLPSHYDNLLSKLYPSFPIYYAISRHLYNQNIHMNTQQLNRIWIKIREQADHYFKALKTVNLPFCLLTRVRYYSEYKSAESGLLPMRRIGLMNKYNRALIEQFESTHGIIREFWCLTWKKKIKYDTRHFHNLFFGSKYVKKDKKKLGNTGKKRFFKKN